MPDMIFTLIVFLYGIIIGSFLNVCIYRLPTHENIITTRSHCMTCGYQLKWYDLIPVSSFLILKGRCRQCGAKISLQYPLIETLNGVLYVAVYVRYGLCIESFLYCFLASALIVLAVIDFRTYEIPVGFNIFIGCLGVIQVLINLSDWIEYAIGFASVSAFLYMIYLVTKGAGIGGGDVKLMAASGLLLGWKCNILAFVLGCIIGSVMHLIRMKVSDADHVLAMGPYLAIGIMIAALYGDTMITWYCSVLGM